MIEVATAKRRKAKRVPTLEADNQWRKQDFYFETKTNTFLQREWICTKPGRPSFNAPGIQSINTA